MKRLIFASVLTFSAFLLPGVSQAAFLLDTGTPTGTGAPLKVSSSQSLAGEFSATAGETITQLAAYLTPSTGNGNSLLLDIYSSPFLATRPTSLHQDITTTATLNPTGWTSASVDWVVPTTGNYWFVVANNSSATTFDMPLEAASDSGTVPALGFAFAPSSGQFASLTTTGIGLEVSGIIPEPATFGMLSGLGLLVVALGKQFRPKQA
jgi:hypothetical protein